MTRPLRFLAASLLLAAAPTMVTAQSVESVVNDMYEAYERQTASIDDYTLVQSTMGFQTELYFEKRDVEGRSVFTLVSGGMGGGSFSLAGSDYGQGDVFMFGPDLVEHGAYLGRETVDGATTHVLGIEDLSVLDLDASMGADDMDFVPGSGRIYVDAETFVMRRMEMDGTARGPDGPQDVTMRMDQMDIRSIQGLLIPHRTVMTIIGMGAMISDEDRAQLEEMERRFQDMPADQRAMMERMMGDRLQQLRDMLSGGDDEMTMEVIVASVRVNTGPPGF